MAEPKNYSPKSFVLYFGGVPLQGYEDGTSIEVEFSEDAFSKKTGNDGQTVRVQNPDESGSITVTLQATSPSNDVLSAIAIADRRGLSGVGIKPIMLKDLNGNTVCASAYAWVRKMPNVQVTRDAPPREWVFDCAELNMFVGGAVS